MIRKEKSPARGDLTSGSPWALISISPTAFQQQLGHSTSDRGHQALRYHSADIVAHCRYKSTGKIERLTLGPDFILSHSISGTARLSSGQPRSPGFTSRSAAIVVHCRYKVNWKNRVAHPGL